MMKGRARLTMLGAMIALVPIGATRFGGWAVITVDDLPDYAEAGKTVNLSYVVRQHGVTLLNGLSPTAEARSGSQVVRASVKPAGGDGHYNAQFVLPSAGAWTITIHSGFMRSEVTLLPFEVVAPNSTPIRIMASVERGRRLFVAKGCVTCHVRDDVPGSGVIAVGPDLSGKRFAPQYLASFLADPSIKPPAANGARMPKLDLRSPEIASLTAFINADRQVSTR
jgi:mono/diheme cytochrome c family protein